MYAIVIQSGLNEHIIKRSIFLNREISHTITFHIFRFISNLFDSNKSCYCEFRSDIKIF